MSRFYEATCDDNGVVFCEGFEIPEADVLSEGNAPSEGLLFLQKGVAKYLTSNASDLKATLDKIADALQQIADGLEALDTSAFIKTVSGGGGSPAVGTPSPPVATANISEIRSLKAELDTLKDGLK